MRKPSFVAFLPSGIGVVLSGSNSPFFSINGLIRVLVEGLSTHHLVFGRRSELRTIVKSQAKEIVADFDFETLTEASGTKDAACGTSLHPSSADAGHNSIAQFEI